MVLAVAVCVVGCAEEAANTRVSAVPLDNSQYSNVFVRVHPDSDEDSVVERVVSGQRMEIVIGFESSDTTTQDLAGNVNMVLSQGERDFIVNSATFVAERTRSKEFKATFSMEAPRTAGEYKCLVYLGTQKQPVHKQAVMVEDPE